MPSSGQRARLKGTVTNSKMEKTVVVTVKRRVKHPLYKKYINRSKKYSVHDEKSRCREGDVVEIISTRPFSKTKRWAVAKILEKAKSDA